MSVDMQKQAASVSLEKAMKVSMEKGNDPGEISAQVLGFIDVSGSMTHRFQRPQQARPKRKLFGKSEPQPTAPEELSEMEVTVARDLGLVLTGLDDDQQVPTWAFDDNLRDMGTVTEQNYESFLTDWLDKNNLGYGTNYMPFFNKVMEQGPSPTNSPILALVHTDGVASDAEQFKQAVVQTSGENVFWVFVGHGVSLNFLRDLDTMGGRVVDNVSLTEVQDAALMTDEEYYDRLVHEFIVDWYPAARKAGVVK